MGVGTQAAGWDKRNSASDLKGAGHGVSPLTQGMAKAATTLQYTEYVHAAYGPDPMPSSTKCLLMRHVKHGIGSCTGGLAGARPNHEANPC